MTKSDRPIWTSPGALIAVIGVLHEIAGLILYRAEIADMFRAGLFNTVMPSTDPSFHGRQAAFWFLVAGPVVIMMGALAHWVEARVGTLPMWLGASLLALTAIGVLMFPSSGFWLFFVPCAMLLRCRRTEVPS